LPLLQGEARHETGMSGVCVHVYGCVCVSFCLSVYVRVRMYVFVYMRLLMCL